MSNFPVLLLLTIVNINIKTIKNEDVNSENRVD